MLVCRMCKHGSLDMFLDLGFTPPADSFLRKDQLREPETYYPLEVMLCSDCGLVQLSHVVSPEVLYRHDYPYESSMTRTGQQHWAEFAASTVKRLGLGKDDLVVDIGSNVGVLLEAFRNNGTRILGVDPASNIARIAERRGIETLDDFMSVDVATRIVSQRGRAAVITGTNVFAHVDDLTALLQAIDVLLEDRGMFIIEAPYLTNLVDAVEYDTIYHEHLSYLSLTPIVTFVRRFGMEVVDVAQRDIHGGSFRVFIARTGKHPVSQAVGTMLDAEERGGLHSLPSLKEFARKVEQNRQDLLWLLRSLKHDGKTLAGLSAPAKGMTLLNYCRIGPETLDFVTEKSLLKIGRFTPGGHIPVVADSELIERRPDYALLMAWNFADEIIANLHEYRARGGRFIIPIPTPRIVS